MSDAMDIKESETGVVRVFHLDLPPEAIERYTVQAGTGEWPLMYGLGAKKLSAAHLDIVDIRDLAGMPLSQYLIEAHAVPEDKAAEMAGQLDRLRGHVIIAPSAAFARTAQTITARTPLRWVASFETARPRTMAPPLKSDGAKGKLTGQTQDADQGPLMRYLLIGLGVVIALFVLVLLL